MSKFDEMKAETLKHYPSIRQLPWYKRLKAVFLPKTGHTMTISDGDNYRKLHATLVTIDGRDYTYCWGRHIDSLPEVWRREANEQEGGPYSLFERICWKNKCLEEALTRIIRQFNVYQGAPMISDQIKAREIMDERIKEARSLLDSTPEYPNDDT